MAKEKICNRDFVNLVKERLVRGVSHYDMDDVSIRGNFKSTSVSVEVSPTFGLSVQLTIEADLLKDPDNAPVTSRLQVSGSSHHTPATALLLASIVEDLAILGTTIEASFSDKTVFYQD